MSDLTRQLRVSFSAYTGLGKDLIAAATRTLEDQEKKIRRYAQSQAEATANCAKWGCATRQRDTADLKSENERLREIIEAARVVLPVRRDPGPHSLQKLVNLASAILEDKS